jgi:hypothetical protein
MTGSVGDKAIVDSAAIASKDSNTVYTLADVLEREFSELHQEVTDETLARDRTAATQANQQQPLEDPSLSPTDHQTRARPSSALRPAKFHRGNRISERGWVSCGRACML